jgi:uncharacterized protein YcbK (DUF882 family)
MESKYKRDAFAVQSGRRGVLRHLVYGAAALPFAVYSHAAAAFVKSSALAGGRSLAFEHTHTGETLSVTYAVGDSYIPTSLQAINRILRDHRTGTEHPIDPILLDQLHRLAAVTGSSQPFQVICGYRSEATNAMLRSRSRGVAEHSLHLEGQAIDIRLADVPLTDLRDAALSLKAGGVGYYAASNFIHVDTGRVRRW